jgi:hypothetical protein
MSIGVSVRATKFAHDSYRGPQSGQSTSGYSWADKRASSKDTYNETLIAYSIFAGLDYVDKPYYNLSTNIGMIRKGGKEEIVLTDELYPYCASREKILPSGFYC